MMTNGNEKRPLPNDWTWTTFEDVTDLSSGKAFKKSEYADEGIRLLQIANVSFGEIIWDNLVYMPQNYTDLYPQLLLKTGDILMALNRPILSGKLKIGRLSEKDAPAILYQRVGRFDVFDERLKPFLLYYCQSPGFMKSLEDSLQGVDQPFINKSKLMKFPFPLAPIPEQERIVAEIEKQFTRLDQAVASLRRLNSNLARYKASVLKAACEGRLVPQDPANEPAEQLLVRILAERRAQWQAANPGKKYKEPVGVEETAELPDLPDGWIWSTMDQIADQRLGKMLDKSKNTGQLRPYLRNANVRWFGFDLSDIQELRASDDELDNISVNYGDLVVCEGGEPGRSAVWEKEEPFVIQKALHRVRPASGISPWYLNFRLASDASTGRLEKYFTGSTIKHFTGQSLRSYVIPLPPLAEQERIVAEVERRLSVVTAVEQTITANLSRAERLRQSILHRAFTGQLV